MPQDVAERARDDVEETRDLVEVAHALLPVRLDEVLQHELVEALEVSFPLSAQEGRRMLIFAGNRDKDLVGMLEILAPKFERIYLTNVQNSLRCETPAQLAKMLAADRRSAVMPCSTSAEAWRQARTEAGPGDLLCITGSVFLAGELRPVISLPV